MLCLFALKFLLWWWWLFSVMFFSLLWHPNGASSLSFLLSVLCEAHVRHSLAPTPTHCHPRPLSFVKSLVFGMCCFIIIIIFGLGIRVCVSTFVVVTIDRLSVVVPLW